MKSVFVLIFLFLFSSCKEHSSEIILKNETSFEENNNIEKMKIVGRWMMCSELSNGTIIQYNVCPMVHFNYDGTGSVGLGCFTNFKWRLEKGILTILNNSTFSDTTYAAIFAKQGNKVNLEISDLKRDVSFYLSK